MEALVHRRARVLSLTGLRGRRSHDTRALPPTGEMPADNWGKGLRRTARRHKRRVPLDPLQVIMPAQHSIVLNARVECGSSVWFVPVQPDYEAVTGVRGANAAVVRSAQVPLDAHHSYSVSHCVEVLNIPCRRAAHGQLRRQGAWPRFSFCPPYFLIEEGSPYNRHARITE